MPLIKINGNDYEFDTLPEQAKEQLNMLRFVDAELQRLKARTAALQMARNSYGRVLLAALPAVLPENQTLN